MLQDVLDHPKGAIYPVNVFVATFIGSPPMNILTCEIVIKNNDLMIKIDEDIFTKSAD